MNKHGLQGFTIIELMVAMAIASVLLVVLFQGLFMINRAANTADTMITTTMRSLLLQQVLERDLTGACLLLDNQPPQENPKQEQQPQQQTKQQAGNQQKQPEQPKEQEKPKKKIITEIFKSVNAGGSLKSLTFISNNPLRSFYSASNKSKKVGHLEPNLVRITYNLDADPGEPGSMLLRRLQTATLEPEKEHADKGTIVLRGIKKLVLKYTAKIEVTEKQEAVEQSAVKPVVQHPVASQQKPGASPEAQKKPAKPTIHYRYETSDTWTTDKKEGQETDKKEGSAQEKKSPLPVSVRVEAEVFNEAYTDTVDTSWIIPIIADTEFVDKRQQVPAPKPPAQQPPQGPGQQSQQPPKGPSMPGMAMPLPALPGGQR